MEWQQIIKKASLIGVRNLYAVRGRYNYVILHKLNQLGLFPIVKNKSLTNI